MPKGGEPSKLELGNFSPSAAPRGLSSHGFLERKQCRLKLLGLKFVFHILRTSEFLARSLFNFKRTDSLQFITVWFGEKRNNVIF